MPEEVKLEIQSHHESWLNSTFFKWCPTSMELLREAERNILKYLTTSFRGFFVKLGNIVGKEENQMWTVTANENSEKTPMVLMHGFGAGSAIWLLNLDSFAENRPIYAIDILGFGRSSRPRFNSEALEAEAEFINSIEMWRKYVKLDKFILLGHSFGGFLAASYAIKHPERVSHLILADPWGFPEQPLDVEHRYTISWPIRLVARLLQSFNPLFAVRAAGPFGRKIIERARPDLVKKFSHKLENAEESIPAYLYHCNAQNPSGETAFHNMMLPFGWAKYPMVHRIDSLRKEVPMTLIYGARSWIDRDPGIQIQYMRKQSYVNIEIIQGAGHHVYADKATNFNRIVNNIASHTDKGTLPPITELTEDTKEQKMDIFEVRRDETYDVEGSSK